MLKVKLCPGEGGDREDRSGDLGELLCGDPGGAVVYGIGKK